MNQKSSLRLKESPGISQGKGSQSGIGCGKEREMNGESFPKGVT